MCIAHAHPLFRAVTLQTFPQSVMALMLTFPAFGLPIAPQSEMCRDGSVVRGNTTPDAGGSSSSAASGG